jgi:hypothetical protein
VRRVQIAMLGGLNGLTTGVPSGIKGRAIPSRCWQYAAGMGRVAGEIGKLERRVQAGGAVTEGERSRLGKCMKMFSGSVIWVFRGVANASTELVPQSRVEVEARTAQARWDVEADRVGVRDVKYKSGGGAIDHMWRLPSR